ncbi:hypothetical protein BH24ACT2_BH24ACT2_09550 [soil metagenome]
MSTVLMVEPADDQRDLTIRSGGAVPPAWLVAAAVVVGLACVLTWRAGRRIIGFVVRRPALLRLLWAAVPPFLVGASPWIRYKVEVPRLADVWSA